MELQRLVLDIHLRRATLRCWGPYPERDRNCLRILCIRARSMHDELTVFRFLTTANLTWPYGVTLKYLIARFSIIPKVFDPVMRMDDPEIVKADVKEGSGHEGDLESKKCQSCPHFINSVMLAGLAASWRCPRGHLDGVTLHVNGSRDLGQAIPTNALNHGEFAENWSTTRSVKGDSRDTKRFLAVDFPSCEATD